MLIPPASIPSSTFSLMPIPSFSLPLSVSQSFPVPFLLSFPFFFPVTLAPPLAVSTAGALAFAVFYTTLTIS